MEFIYDALQYVVDILSFIKDFFYSIPDLLMDIFTYIWYLGIKFYLSIKISMVEMAYSIASMLLTNYEVYTVLNSLFNNMSPDLRNACYQLGVVEAIRIVIDALATAFVLRIMGW